MSSIALPQTGLEVLTCLHRHRREATVRELRESLSNSRPMSHGAMVTLLKRLESKRLVRKRKGPVGKAFVYCPTRDSRATLTPVVRAFVQRVFGGDVFALIGSLFDTRPPSADELEQLEQLLDKLRRQQEGK